MYAQTVAYGLFAARCNSKEKDFTRAKAAYSLPKTNPFLRKLFNAIAGPDLDERLSWIVDDLCELISRADIDQILVNFRHSTGKEDPVVHFYETFLSVYDPETREKRGIFYTPTQVVSYIVSSVDYILRKDFDKSMGLADGDIFMLDPACGTGTFLFKSVDKIYEYFDRQPGLWKTYVADKLLKRLYGFEILMAPYSIAHLKLALQLQDLGYDLSNSERLGIYLTNTLEEAAQKSERIFANWISEEANAAAEIKKNRPIMVIVGNPPYLKLSINQGKWITDLIEDYKKVDGNPLKERKIWLYDDYVKFLRFGQWRIDRTGQGVLAFITNHGYLDNPTFRGLRNNLLQSFNTIYILNLHGNSKKKEVSPDGGVDENVFDIQQGVAIGIFVKDPSTTRRSVKYADLWGTWTTKYDFLESHDVHDTEWTEIKPENPYYFFVPKDFTLAKEFHQGWPIPDIFIQTTSGIATARDSLVINFDDKNLDERIEGFLNKDKDDEQIRDDFHLNDTRGWSLSNARRQLWALIDWKTNKTDILYRPFDRRRILFMKELVDWPRGTEMANMLRKGNLGLLTHRPQSPTVEFSHVFCTDALVDQCAAANKTTGGGNTYLFPLFTYLRGSETRNANLNSKFIHELEESLRVKFVNTDKKSSDIITPKEVFFYIYAFLHSPTYRERYSEFLKVEYPRIMIIDDLKVFRSLVDVGEELVQLHLLKSGKLHSKIIRFPHTGSNVIEKGYPIYEKNRIYLNNEQYFEGVSSEVWEHSVGGYHVCHKWLKDRVGRKLSYDDLNEYKDILTSIEKTIDYMNKIDEILIWPIAIKKTIKKQSKMEDHLSK